MAGVPGRHDVDRARHRDAVHGHDPHSRKDVRVAAVLRRQARRHGRAHRAVRSASRARRRAVAAARQHRRVARHSRRHGDAASRRCAPKARARSTTSARSSAATSASTSACARSARRSSASRNVARSDEHESTEHRSPSIGGRVRVSPHSAFAPSRRRAPVGSFGMRERRAGARRDRSDGPRCATSFAPARVRAWRRRARSTARRPRALRRVGAGWLRARCRRRSRRRSSAGPALAVTIADCVPVFIAHPSGAIALLHSGWRGTAGAHRRARHRRVDATRLPGVASCASTPARRSAASATRSVATSTRSSPARNPGQADDDRSARAHRRSRTRVGRAPHHHERRPAHAATTTTFFSHRAGDAGRQLGVMIADLR